jgi:hypothetical protein
VYAITSTGRESHLAYQLTVPSSISEVQEELGLNTKGSFVCSVKNPDAPSPANASIGNPAKYPEEIQKKFRGLRWMPLEPELLDYEGAQMLIIGEAQGELGKAVEEQSKDERDEEKEKPVKEMEKLVEEVCFACSFFFSACFLPPVPMSQLQEMPPISSYLDISDVHKEVGSALIKESRIMTASKDSRKMTQYLQIWAYRRKSTRTCKQHGRQYSSFIHLFSISIIVMISLG